MADIQWTAFLEGSPSLIGWNVLLSATKPVSPARTFINNSEYRNLYVEPADGPDIPIDLTGPYENLFGTIANKAGAAIWFKGRMFTDNGFASHPFIVQVIIAP